MKSMFCAKSTGARDLHIKEDTSMLRGRLFGQLISVLLAVSQLQTPSAPARQDHHGGAWTTSSDARRPQSPASASADRASTTSIRTNITSTLQFSLVRPSLEHPDDFSVEKNKPIALYIPGIDGYGRSAEKYQFDDLASTFHFYRLTISPQDRSSFTFIVKAITDFLQEVKRAHDDAHVTLIGESCGGVFAAAAAIKTQETASMSSLLQGIVLVNPATSFDYNSWNIVARPVLTALKNLDHNARDDGQTPYATLGNLLLAAVVPNDDQSKQISDLLLSVTDLRSGVSQDKVRQVVQAISGSLTTRGETERLSPLLLEHRLSRWLAVGSESVSSKLSEIKTPTLVIAGEDDRILPSKREAERLSEIIEGCETLLVKDHGHFLWLDENVNLTEAILYSKIDPLNLAKTQKPYDPIRDWKLPSDIDEYVQNAVKPYRDAFSPAFFSTDSNGKRWAGMGKIPRSSEGTRPLLFVGNHQFAALDVRLLLTEMRAQRGLFPRGLAHPVAFLGGEKLRPELDWRTPGVTRGASGNSKGAPTNPLTGGYESLGAISPQEYYRFGAVKVSPRNFYRLLQTGQNVMLFPGGGKEALSGNKSYPLFWPDKTDFVRIAAKFNATIVPLSAVGMVDSVNVLAEPQEVMNLPFVGGRMRRLFANITAARYDESPEDEALGLPIAVPALSARNYFIFGKPIDTLGIDPQDKEACTRIYREARQEVRRGIDDIIRAREHDPFKSFSARLAYERVFGKKAPTFSVSELN